MHPIAHVHVKIIFKFAAGRLFAIACSWVRAQPGNLVRRGCLAEPVGAPSRPLTNGNMSGEWNAEDIAGEIRVLQIRQKELKQKLKNLPKGSPEKFAIREAIDNVDNQIERKERRMKQAKMKGEAAQFDADFFFATARNNSISTPTPKGSPGESTGTKRSNHRPGQSVPRRKSSLEDDDVASVIGSTGDNRRLQSEIERLMMEQGQLREALVDTQAAHRTDTELSRALEESQAANKRRLHEVSKLQKALVESRKHYKDTMDAESLRVRDLSAALEESGEVVQKLHIKIICITQHMILGNFPKPKSIMPTK